jgi:hypothetical protein
VSDGEATPKAETRATEVNSEWVLPELEPWREVGWIFRDDGCTAVERCGEETRARSVEHRGTEVG